MGLPRSSSHGIYVLCKVSIRGSFPAIVPKLTALHSILPALAFSLDMFSKTGSNYGVNEVLLASVLGSVVFSVFAAQPLVIVGVTGSSLTIDVCVSAANRNQVLLPYSTSSSLMADTPGHVTDFISTVYDIMKDTGVNYIGFMAWIGMCVSFDHCLIPVLKK